MPWWTWVSLAFFAGVVLAASIVALVALRSVSRLQTVGERLQVAFDDLAPRAKSSSDAPRGRACGSSPPSRTSSTCATSLDRFSVLTWAIGDMAKTVGKLRSAVLLQK